MLAKYEHPTFIINGKPYGEDNIPKELKEKITDLEISGTIIGYKAFQGFTGLTNVVIPKEVTTIIDLAFEGCKNLKSVTIPDGVKYIGWEAFKNSGLEKIHIPSSVEEMGYCLFSGCSALSSITADRSSLLHAKGNCLITTGGEIIAGCKNSIVSPDAKFINSNAFEGIDTSKIAFPEWYGKYCNGLVEVISENNKEDIECSFFGGRYVVICNELESGRLFAEYLIKNDAGEYQLEMRDDSQEVFFIDSNGKLLKFACYTDIIYENSALSVLIPPQINDISLRAFDGCDTIHDITIENPSIPYHIEVVNNNFFKISGDGVLLEARGFGDVLIPDGVKEIANKAFEEWRSEIKNVMINNNIILHPDSIPASATVFKPNSVYREDFNFYTDGSKVVMAYKTDGKHSKVTTAKGEELFVNDPGFAHKVPDYVIYNPSTEEFCTSNGELFEEKYHLVAPLDIQNVNIENYEDNINNSENNCKETTSELNEDVAR